MHPLTPAPEDKDNFYDWFQQLEQRTETLFIPRVQFRLQGQWVELSPGTNNITYQSFLEDVAGGREEDRIKTNIPAAESTSGQDKSQCSMLTVSWGFVQMHVCIQHHCSPAQISLWKQQVSFWPQGNARNPISALSLCTRCWMWDWNKRE